MNPRLTFGAVGLLTLGVLTAGGVAFAATPAPSANSPATSTSSPASASASASASAAGSGKDIVLPAGGVLATRTTAFCRRSDELVARITERQAAVDDHGAAAKAKAEKRLARLREHNFDKRADAVQRRIDRRTERATKLPARLSELKAAAAECDSLGLS